MYIPTNIFGIFSHLVVCLGSQVRTVNIINTLIDKIVRERAGHTQLSSPHNRKNNSMSITQEATKTTINYTTWHIGAK